MAIADRYLFLCSGRMNLPVSLDHRRWMEIGVKCDRSYFDSRRGISLFGRYYSGAAAVGSFDTPGSAYAVGHSPGDGRDGIAAGPGDLLFYPHRVALKK